MDSFKWNKIKLNIPCKGERERKDPFSGVEKLAVQVLFIYSLFDQAESSNC